MDEALGPGRFGMAEETGANPQRGHPQRAVPSRQGLGQAVGAYLAAANPPMRRSQPDRRRHIACGIPVTVHVAIGTDIIHMHPDASGAAIGDASLRDFRYFTSCVARLSGGVYLNCGSAVVLPEVLLKAVALARNQGIALDWADHREHRLHAAVSPADQCGEPPGGRHQGTGISLVGHHEVLIPLIAAAVIESEG